MIEAALAYVGRLGPWTFLAGSLPLLVGMSIMMMLLSSLFGIGDTPPHPMVESMARSVLIPIIFGSVIAPLAETLVHQLWTKRILTRLGIQSFGIYALVSAVPFGLAHGLHPGTFLAAFGPGLVFAFGFAARDYPGGKPFLLTAAAHSLRNALATTVAYFW